MPNEIYHRSEWGNPAEQWGNVYLNADLTNELYKRASEYENSWVTDQLLNGVGTKPSIILTPTAYEDGVLNSVKPSDGNADFDFTRGSSATRVNEKGLVQDVIDTNLPRINYTNFDYENGEVVPYSGEGSLKLEPQSTNLVTYSEDFSQSYWTKQSGVTATYNTTETLSPDGTYNATKFVGNGTTGVFKASISVSGVVSRTFYLKSVTGTTTAVFKDPNTNVPSPITLTITNEWQRFEMIGDNGSSFQGLWIDDITSDGLFMWGAQLEQGSYPTSYIPTNGSTVTRLADVCNNSGSSDLINSTEGVLYAEISALTDDSTNKDITLSNAGLSNRVIIRFSSSTLLVYVISSGVVSMFKSTVINEITSFNKIAIKYKQNDFALWVNGTEIATDTSGNTPIGLNELAFDNGTGNDDFYGNVKCVAVFKEALSDTELQKLTS